MALAGGRRLRKGEGFIDPSLAHCRQEAVDRTRIWSSPTQRNRPQRRHHRMRVAIAYHAGDEQQAHAWFSWCEELGCGEKHDLVVLPFKGLIPPPIRGWKSVTLVTDYSGVKSAWSGDGHYRDAAGPNHSFRELAKAIEKLRAPCFAFVEPDAIPMGPEAFDLIESDHLASGKRFSGITIDVPNVPKHMAGVAVYPGDLALTSDNYMRPRLAQYLDGYIEVAFDVAGSPDAFASFHETKLIQQIFRGKPFDSVEEMEQTITEDAVLFHSDKTHSIPRLMRAEKYQEAPPTAPLLDPLPKIALSAVPLLVPRWIVKLVIGPLVADIHWSDGSVETILLERIERNYPLSNEPSAAASSGPRVKNIPVSRGAWPKGLGAVQRDKSKKKHVRTPEEQAQMNIRMAKARGARKKK